MNTLPLKQALFGGVGDEVFEVEGLEVGDVLEFLVVGCFLREDGRTIRAGKLLRTAELSKASDADVVLSAAVFFLIVLSVRRNVYLCKNV